MLTVIRTWESNHDQNRMSLEAAVENLVANAIDYPEGTSADERRADIHKRLLAGKTVETPLAVFQSYAASLQQRRTQIRA